MDNWQVIPTQDGNFHIDNVETGDRLVVEGSNDQCRQLAERVGALLNADDRSRT